MNIDHFICISVDGCWGSGCIDLQLSVNKPVEVTGLITRYWFHPAAREYRILTLILIAGSVIGKNTKRKESCRKSCLFWQFPHFLVQPLVFIVKKYLLCMFMFFYMYKYICVFSKTRKVWNWWFCKNTIWL